MSICWFDSVDSTNTEIKKAIRAHKPEKTVIAAFEQKAGYGRQGRTWHSPIGGLYLSLLLRPYDHGVSPQHVSTLSLALSLAIKHLLASRVPHLQTSIKWPNDVLIQGGKVAGISVELVDNAACVGIGVNIFEPFERASEFDKQAVQGKYSAQYIANFIDDSCLGPSKSSGVLSEAHKEFIREIARALIVEVYSVYDQWLVGGFPHLRSEYLACSALHEQRIQLLSVADDLLLEGTVCDVDEVGCLVLMRDDGSVVHASSGEVHLV